VPHDRVADTGDGQLYSRAGRARGYPKAETVLVIGFETGFRTQTRVIFDRDVNNYGQPVVD
jgi:hypothetical protein